MTRPDYAATMARINATGVGPAVRDEPAARSVHTAPPAERARRTVAEFTDRLRSAGHDPAVMLAGAEPHRVEAIAGGALARTDLCRMVPFELVRASGAPVDGASVEGDGLTIEGYGAVFDSPTEINSWEGHFQETIRKGAFKKSLREQGAPKMQFDHGHHPLLGGLPLGTWTTAEEDDRGLHLLGRMYDNWLVQPFRDAIADPNGGVDGMSFRFSVVREEWRDNAGKVIKDDNELFELLYYGAGDRGPITRELIEVKVPEAGPVVWPAYQDTEVGARSADGGTLTLDLARLRANPRALADVAALVDSEAGRAERGGILARVSAVSLPLVRSAAPETPAVVHTEPVHTEPPERAASASTETQPPATDEPAVDHPPASGAPVDTGDSAGEHSSSSQRTERPGNPTERREQIRAAYRTVLERTLALPES